MNTMVLLVAALFAADEVGEPVTKTEPSISVQGTIVMPDGEPIENAQVVLRTRYLGGTPRPGFSHRRDVLARVITKADGRFTFNKVPIPSWHPETIESLERQELGAEIVAWSEKRGVAWSHVSSFAPLETVRLQLSEQANVKGVIRDAGGKPVANVAIQAWGLTHESTRLSAFFDGPDALNVGRSEVQFIGLSDEQGQFQIHHLPADQRISLFTRAAGFESQTLMVDTAASPQADEITFENGGKGKHPLHRSPLDITLKPQRSVLVHVRDAMGQAVTDGAVQGTLGERPSLLGTVNVNARGEATIPLRETGKLTLIYRSDPLRPRLSATVTSVVNADEPLAPITIQLPDSKWLAGHVIDALSRQPVAGVTVDYGSELPGSSSKAVSSVDGAFRIPVLAGKGSLRLLPYTHGYFFPTSGREESSPTRIDVPAEGEIPSVALALNRGLVIRGKVRDSKNAGVRGVEVRGINTAQPFHTMCVRSDEDGNFQLSGFSPRVEVMVTALAEVGAAYAIVPADAKHPITTDRIVPTDLVLKSGVTLVGQVDQQGIPVPKARLKVIRSVGPNRNQQYQFGYVQTNAQGKYRIPGFEQGDRFQLKVELGPERDAIDWQYDGSHENVVGEGPEITLVPAELVDFRQTLRGIVVDPDGKPVPGVTVSAELLSGENLRSRGNSTPWTETEKDGKFELTNLPSQPLQLMAYVRPPGPGGGVIRFPVKVKPSLGQSDIRIVLDPRLLKDIEDLDAIPQDPKKK